MMDAAALSIDEQRQTMERLADGKVHPMEIKLELARRIVALYHRADYALRAAASSAIQRFQFSSSGSRNPQLARRAN